jgi:hypothetical protein
MYRHSFILRLNRNRLRGVLLTAMGADETQIEASFCEASHQNRKGAEVDSAGKTRGSKLRSVPQQKASGSGGLSPA